MEAYPNCPVIPALACPGCVYADGCGMAMANASLGTMLVLALALTLLREDGVPEVRREREI